MAKVISVFVNNLHLSAAGIQFLVGLTTLLMVLRFLLDYLRHRSIGWIMRNFLLMLDTATYALLHYSLGVMQRPSEQNSYYQVWAVLLVTLRYSVKHGRPAGVALKQTPLVDLMSSFWAANILRSRAPAMLKIPVWLMWSINSARIIHGFVSSEHATANHRENVRLVTEYMRPKTSASINPVTMSGYKYLVLGEDKQRKKVRPPHYRLELELTEEEKLITVDKIWQWSKDDQTSQGKRVSELLNQRGGELKDLCLSFALYKLLRRRFFNLPIHESNLQETKRFIFEGILNPATQGAGPAPSAGQTARRRGNQEDEGAGQSTDHHPVPNYKRALRIAKVELSFLNDFFFSRHALMFATGFPFLRLILSTLLVGAISYMAVAINRFSKIAKEDELARVHHGVVFTWILLTLLGVKEIIEIASYVFSDWTKVLLLCKYVRQPWWLRGPVMAMLVRLLCRYSLVRRWNGRTGQYNLIFSRRLARYQFRVIYLTKHIQEAIFVSLRRLANRQDMPSSDMPYVDRALLLIPKEKVVKKALKTTIDGVLEDFRGEVHRILLWHIATCYCECHLLADNGNIDVSRPRNVGISWFSKPKRAAVIGPFIQKSKLESPEYGWSSIYTQHYITAVRLSQYCAHLLNLPYPLIPGNEIIVTAVFEEVASETCQALKGCFSITETFEKLRAMVDPQDKQESEGKEAKQDEQGSKGKEAKQDDANHARKQRTLLKMGLELGHKLIETTNDNDEVLWKFLAELWAGYVLHLAESTRASKHKIYLGRGGDLITHLWALLSHAGFMGRDAHGDMGTGVVPNIEPDRQAIEINN